VRMVAATLGDNSAVLGAAVLARQKSLDRFESRATE